jgi:hypothetical protein
MDDLSPALLPLFCCSLGCLIWGSIIVFGKAADMLMETDGSGSGFEETDDGATELCDPQMYATAAQTCALPTILSASTTKGAQIHIRTSPIRYATFIVR